MTKYQACLEDVKKFKGLYPYGVNPSMGDGYFYENIKKNFSPYMVNKAMKECERVEFKIKELCDTYMKKWEEENKMVLKTVEEYSKEMTRSEFDSFTELEELCPHHLNLKSFMDGKGECNYNCDNCYEQALVGINFKVAVPALPDSALPILKALGQLEVQVKTIKDQAEKLKIELLEAMETYGVKKWDNEVMTISYTAPTTRTSVDSASLKKEQPDIFVKYSKTSNVKASIRIKLKGDK